MPPQPGVHFTADTILTLRESVVRVISSRAVGSGAIVDDQGLVVTGRNAVGNDPTVLVEMVDGSKKTGIVLGIDSIAGLALLRISGDGYTSLPLGDVSSLKAGDALLTLGFPEQGAVGETEWELEALPAMVSAAGPAEGISYVNVAQSLAPGYAGGPTVDDQGRLVGLTASPGLIIMVDRLKEVMPSLRDGVDISVPAKEDIVYHSRETVLSEAFLFTTDEEGDSERLIPGQKTSNRFVERSPDGSKLVYASPRGLGSNWDIYMANADGSNETRLTHDVSADWNPSWGPAGEKLVFTSGRDGNFEIYMMNADGSEKVRLTENDAIDLAPDISPDGRKIVFVSDRDGNSEIYSMDIDGSNLRRLTDNEAVDGDPRWSPDSRQILFDSDRSGNSDIFVMNALGSNVTPLTDSEGTDLTPDWSPDGSKIVYAGELPSGGLEIFVMNADGSENRRVTVSGGLKSHPRWGALPSAYALRAIQRLHCLCVRQAGRDGHLPHGAVREPRLPADGQPGAGRVPGLVSQRQPHRLPVLPGRQRRGLRNGRRRGRTEESHSQLRP